MKFLKSMTIGLVVILVITPLIITPFYIDYFYYPKILFINTIALSMAGGWFINREEYAYKEFFSSKILKYYLILVIISTFFSIEPTRSLWGIFRREEGLFAIMTYIFIFIVASNFYTFSNNHVKFILLSASVVASYGIFQYFGYDPIPRDFIRMNWQGRSFSTLGNPNFLGTYLTLMLPISVYAYVYSRKIEYLASSSIIYLALLCTMTRGAWIGAFVGIILLCFFLLKFKYSRKHLAVILSLFMIITIFMNQNSNGGVFSRFLTIPSDIENIITQSDEYEKAGANRIFIWVRVLDLIKEKPLFGYGLETLDIVFTEKFHDEILDMYGRLYPFDKAHNEYLHIAVSTGIPSLMLYLCFISVVLYKTFVNVKRNPMIIPFLGSIIGYLVQAFFNISVVSVAYIFWIFLGIIINFSLAAENENTE